MPTVLNEVSRLKLLHPDLGYDAGAGLHAALEALFVKLGDNVNGRYSAQSAIADSTLVNFEHNIGVALDELAILIYTGSHPNLTRVVDPVAAGWTIVATSGQEKTQIDVTTPATGGPHTFVIVVIHGKNVEKLDDLNDVDLTTTPPTLGQTLVYDGANWVPGQSAGSGEINYITNSDGEADTTGWTTYADAPQALPEDGTGPAANIVFSVQSSVILRGNKSFKIAKDAVNRIGQGVSYDFTIKEQDVNKKNKIQFDFKSNEDAAFAQGDLTVYIYDITNSLLITPVDTDIPVGQNIFQTSFVSTSSTSFRLIFHIASTNASAWDFYFDNVIVGPGMTSQGAAIGDWISFNGSVNDRTGTATVTYTDRACHYRRVGSDMEVTGQITINTVSGATTPVIALPSGFTIDSARIEAFAIIGSGTLFDSSAGTTFSIGFAADYSTGRDTDVFIRSVDGSTIPALGNGDQLRFNFKMPISEWAGKGIVPMLAEDNLSQWQDYSSEITPPANSTVSAKFRRVGQEMEIIWNQTATGASTALDPVLPSAYNLDSEVTGTSTHKALGFGTFLDSGTAFYEAIGKYSNSPANTLVLRYDNGTSLQGIPALAASDEINIAAKVPILEWKGSQNSLVGFSLASETSAGLLNYYATESVTLDNGITGTAVFTRIGNTVHVTGTGAWTHASNSSISTSSGLIPPKFRPSSDLFILYSLSGDLKRVTVATNGTLTILYFDASLAAVANTTTTRAPSFSYVIT